MSKREHTKHVVEIDNKFYKAVIENGKVIRHYETGTGHVYPTTKEGILFLVNHLTEVLNCLEELEEKVQVKETAQVKLRKPRELPSATRQVKESGFLEK